MFPVNFEKFSEYIFNGTPPANCFGVIQVSKGVTVKQDKISCKTEFCIFTVNFEYISHLVLVFLLLTLNM